MIKAKIKNTKTQFIGLLIFNVAVLAILVSVLTIYSIENRSAMYHENVKKLEIETENNSSQLESYFVHQYNNMLSKKKYLQNADNAFTLDTAMEYLCESNYSDYQLYQLVDQLPSYEKENGELTTNPAEKRPDVASLGRRFYTTYTAKDGTGQIYQGYYKSPSLAFFGSESFTLAGIDDGKINSTGQFSIPMEYYVGGKIRSYVEAVALYTAVTLPQNNESFLLFCTVALQDILVSGVPIVNYEKADSVLITTAGRFISKTNEYLTGSNSSFQSYLKEVYGYESAFPGEILSKMQTEESGSLDIKTGRGENTIDAVLTFNEISNANWIYLAIVPVTSLETTENWTYVIILITVILFLMIVDFAIIVSANNRLKVSLIKTEEAGERERAANMSKSSFLSRMSHEIRTPLNAVIGYNTIARNKLSDAITDEERKDAEMKVMDCLMKSDIASKHLLTVINDVLDMSAIESGKIKITNDKFDFRGLITSLTTVFYSQARQKGIDFEVIFNDLTEEWFIGDQMRVNQVLTNLLSNAIKFVPEGGSVKLIIQQLESDDNSTKIRFEVSDTGIGMTSEYLSHIWTPFEQADSSISRRFGGSGLGLSITKNLVDLMGGTINVQSQQGVGTTFYVDLRFERTEQVISNEAYDFSTINALVVDDDVSTCDYIRLLFNRCGAKCATVNSGIDAIEAVSISIKDKKPFSICLVDWRMPKMDGIETIKRIRKVAGNEIPIIILTAYDYTELADKAMEVGVNKFISKPLFQSSLFDLLANICGKQHPIISKRTDKADFKGARILLAEDNAMNMEIATTILKSAGLVVDSAWDGQEAVRLFSEAPEGTYMAILMDVHMPVMNGHEAAKAIRASSHKDALTIPIIAMTADAFVENVAEAYASGMNAHISKPIDIPMLFSTLKKYL